MNSGFFSAHAVFARDIAIAYRSGGGWFYGLFFFAVFAALAAIAFGPELNALRAAAPAVVWLASALSVQFAVNDLFEDDFRDGSLAVVAAQEESVLPYWAGKTASVAVTAAAPVILATPLVLLFLGVKPGLGVMTALQIAIGMPAIVFIAVFSSALAVGLRAGGLLAMIIASPFAAPALIFGVSATKALFANQTFMSPEVLILAALSLFMGATTAGFSVLALRLSLE